MLQFIPNNNNNKLFIITKSNQTSLRVGWKKRGRGTSGNALRKCVELTVHNMRHCHTGTEEIDARVCVTQYWKDNLRMKSRWTYGCLFHSMDPRLVYVLYMCVCVRFGFVWVWRWLFWWSRNEILFLTLLVLCCRELFVPCAYPVSTGPVMTLLTCNGV